MVTITLRKHSASIEREAVASVCRAGRLTVHTEDPLAEQPDTQIAAHAALYELASLLEAGGYTVSVVDARDKAADELPLTTDEGPPGEDDANPLDGTLIGT